MQVDARDQITATDTWYNCDASGTGFFYEIRDGDLTVVERTDTSADPDLHIRAGVTLRVQTGRGIHTNNGGMIIAEGAVGTPVTFDGLDGQVIGLHWSNGTERCGMA